MFMCIYIYIYMYIYIYICFHMICIRDFVTEESRIGSTSV